MGEIAEKKPLPVEECESGTVPRHAGAGLGDYVPEPLGFIAFTPECWFYTEGTGTEDRAPQGCDPSADSRAGMARGGLP